MRGFFSFDKMITPIFIKLFFILGIIGSIISGIFMIGMGFISDQGGFIQIITGIICLFLGPIIVRIYCEMLIVFFKMQESLIHIRDYHKEKQEVTQQEHELI